MKHRGSFPHRMHEPDRHRRTNEQTDGLSVPSVPSVRPFIRWSLTHSRPHMLTHYGSILSTTIMMFAYLFTSFACHSGGVKHPQWQWWVEVSDSRLVDLASLAPGHPKNWRTLVTEHCVYITPVADPEIWKWGGLMTCISPVVANEHLYFTKHGSIIYIKKRKTTKLT